MTDSVTLDVEAVGGSRAIAIVRIDRPPVNAIDDAVKQQLLSIAAGWPATSQSGSSQKRV